MRAVATPCARTATPPRSPPRAHGRRRMRCHPPAATAVRAACRLRRRLLGHGRRDCAARLQMRLPPGCVWCLPCTRTARLRFAPWQPGDELVTNRFGIPEPDLAPDSLLRPDAMALVLLPLVGFTRAAIGLAWAAATTTAASPSAAMPAPPLLVGVGFALPAGRTRLRRAWDVRAGRGLHRDAGPTASDGNVAMKHARRYWLMKSEPDAFSIDDLRTRRHRAVDRRAQLPGAQFHARRCSVGDQVLFYHSSTGGAGHRRHRRGGQRTLSGPDAVQEEVATTSTRRARGRNRAGRWSTSASSASSSARSRWRNSRRMPTQLEGFALLRARQPPVGAAGHRGAVETTPLTGIDRPDTRSPQNEGKRLSGEKAAEYVDDGSIVGVGTGSTVAFFIEALGRMKRSHRRRGVQFRAEHRACSSTASRCSTSTPPARWRCTSTAPTSATRTSA